MTGQTTILGERVRMLRERAGLSQPELARRVGIRQQSIDKIERGISTRSRYLVEIAVALGVNAAYLQGLTDDPSPEPIRARVEAALDQVPDDQLADVLQLLRRYARE